jgi:DNA-binding NarL/FixJ family response regulator
MTKHSKKIRILVADDHELVRQGIRGLLQSQPDWLVVGEAADGRETIAKARKLRPDVAILDIGMPVQDGLEATRQIREAAPDTKVLILTMHQSDQLVRRVLDAGALV